MRAQKKSKVDTSLGPVNIKFADMADIDRAIYENSEGINVEANLMDNVSHVSDTMRDGEDA